MHILYIVCTCSIFDGHRTHIKPIHITQHTKFTAINSMLRPPHMCDTWIYQVIYWISSAILLSSLNIFFHFLGTYLYVINQLDKTQESILYGNEQANVCVWVDVWVHSLSNWRCDSFCSSGVCIRQFMCTALLAKHYCCNRFFKTQHGKYESSLMSCVGVFICGLCHSAASSHKFQAAAAAVAERTYLDSKRKLL